MIIEYDLQGSITHHRGVFDTTGFYAVFEEDKEALRPNLEVSNGWKIYGLGSFSFFHVNYDVALEVYRCLCDVMDGVYRLDIEGVGHIRRIR